MGLRTSVYLTDELAATWKASGLPLAEVIRRGLSAAGPVDEATLRHVLREELAGLPAAAGRAPVRYAAAEYVPEPFEEAP